jgi:hypothetical protein
VLGPAHSRCTRFRRRGFEFYLFIVKRVVEKSWSGGAGREPHESPTTLRDNLITTGSHRVSDRSKLLGFVVIPGA